MRRGVMKNKVREEKRGKSTRGEENKKGGGELQGHSAEAAGTPRKIQFFFFKEG